MKNIITINWRDLFGASLIGVAFAVVWTLGDYSISAWLGTPTTDPITVFLIATGSAYTMSQSQ